MPDVARTLDLPSGQRFEYWKHILTNTVVPLEVSTPGNGDDFRGRLRGCELGSLRFIEVSAEAHTARRTARLVKAAPAGCYKIGLQLRGSSVLIQDGREATLTPGDFTLYDTDRPYTLAFSDPHRMLVLVFPRDMLGLPESRLAGLTATRLPGAPGGQRAGPARHGTDRTARLQPCGPRPGPPGFDAPDHLVHRGAPGRGRPGPGADRRRAPHLAAPAAQALPRQRHHRGGLDQAAPARALRARPARPALVRPAGGSHRRALGLPGPGPLQPAVQGGLRGRPAGLPGQRAVTYPPGQAACAGVQDGRRPTA